MKKFLKFMMAFFLGTLIIAGSGICQSCDHRPTIPIDDEEFQDKLEKFLPEAMQNLYAFDNMTDVMLYKQERGTQAFVDSVFLSMTDQQVANVVSVLKKQQGSFGVSDIVYEFNANRRIYVNLPDEQMTPAPSITEKEQPDPPVADPVRDSIANSYGILKK